MSIFSLPDSLASIRGRDITEGELVTHGDEWSRAFSPILWYHPDENFFPEDCANLLPRSELRQNGRRRSLDSLAQLDGADEDSYFWVPDLDMDRFTVHGGFADIPGSGPGAVAKVARRQYANNPFVDGDREAELVYYAELSCQELDFSEIDPPPIPEHGVLSRHNGRYLVVQYYFFYIFNDSWNKHVGDWGSGIRVVIPYDFENRDPAPRPLVIYPHHHTKWITEGVDAAGLDTGTDGAYLTNWLILWARERFRRYSDEDAGGLNFGPAFFHGTHPYGFVAPGGHGIYPTPGYSLYFVDIPASDAELPVMADERVIGRYCIHTDDVGRTEIEADLKAGRLKVRAFQNCTWDRCIVLNRLKQGDDPSWLRYKGLWGQPSAWRGWGGPTTPWLREGYRKTLKEMLFEEESGLSDSGGTARYVDGGQLFTGIRNWHAFGNNDLA